MIVYAFYQENVHKTCIVSTILLKL